MINFTYFFGMNIQNQKFVVQSELKAMVGKLIYEVKYQNSARPGGP